MLEGMSFLECTKSNNNLANRAQPVLQAPHLLLGHVQSIVEHSEVLQHTVGDLDDEVRVAPAALQTSGEQEGTHTHRNDGPSQPYSRQQRQLALLTVRVVCGEHVPNPISIP